MTPFDIAARRVVAADVVRVSAEVFTREHIEEVLSEGILGSILNDNIAGAKRDDVD